MNSQALGWPRFRLCPVIVDYIQTNETARERMPMGGLISLPQCLLNIPLSFLITLPGPAPCLCLDDPKILASFEELCQVSPEGVSSSSKGCHGFNKHVIEVCLRTTTFRAVKVYCGFNRINCQALIMLGLTCTAPFILAIT